MLKLIINIRRKAGTTHEAFRKYYEEKHVPLGNEIAKGFVIGYRRNYVQDSFGYFASEGEDAPTANQFDYDCITELWFEDRAALDGLFAKMSQPEVQARVVADEEQFMDRPSLQFMICETVPGQ